MKIAKKALDQVLQLILMKLSTMNKRANFIYELVGQISSKQLKKKKDGNPFYQLTVINSKQCHHQETSKVINVFTDGIKEKEI